MALLSVASLCCAAISLFAILKLLWSANAFLTAFFIATDETVAPLILSTESISDAFFPTKLGNILNAFDQNPALFPGLVSLSSTLTITPVFLLKVTLRLA